ncbi:unnamed protein product [Larinioides sclopetarius]|uniref:Uncharacterized protein n=1 Tax=Larinioides sclopetarius TaxID=280406 RepID=A0AAV2BV32_9ARAC
MYSDANYRKIAFCLLLSFLCSNSVISETIATAAREGDEEERTYDGNRNTTHIDIFHSTTTKRYVREDRPIPTIYPKNKARNGLTEYLAPYVFIIVSILAFCVVSVVFIYTDIKLEMNRSAPQSHSPSFISLDEFPILHRSHEQSDLIPEVQRPPTRRNQVTDPRRESCSESKRTDLFSVLCSNLGETVSPEVTIFFDNSSTSNSSHGSRETDDTIIEMQPQTGILNDLSNPPNQSSPLSRKSVKPIL